KIDSEYFLITTLTIANPGYSSVTASRAQLGSTAATHATQAAVMRVYQLDVLLSSPTVAIGAYQLNVNYDSARLSVLPVNVFPGPGVLGNPVAVNTNTAGVVIVNSFNASSSFQGGPTPIARLYFAGRASGTANISVNFTDLADASGNDMGA